MYRSTPISDEMRAVRTMKRYHLHIYVLFFMLGSFLLVACKKDADGTFPYDPAGGRVTLILHIPGQKIPTAYGMSTADETTVSEVTVLAYQESVGAETLVEKIAVPANQVSVISGGVKIAVDIPTDNYNRIVIVANANAGLSSLSPGSDISELQNLTYTSATGRWDVATPGYIPMSGQITAQTANGIAITEGVAKVFSNVKMTRMLARIDVINQAVSGLTLNKVYLYNLNRNGLIMPGSQYGSSPAQPSLPASVLSIDPNPMVYDFAALSVSGQLSSEIYTFEAAAPQGGSLETSPRLILEGVYNGSTYFYPADFTYNGSNGAATGSYMPIVRNHKYVFTVVEVKGPGFGSAAEALASPNSYTNNIEVKLLAVDDNFQDVYFDKDNLLAVTKSSYAFESSEYSLLTETNLLSILTDVPGGWSAVFTESDGVTTASWLSIMPSTGESGIKANAYIKVTQAAASRTGYIIIKAGRLTARVKIEQTI